jgi:Ran GTPase-activating protein (RanGAP) involved in mRNA processing and transport
MLFDADHRRMMIQENNSLNFTSEEDIYEKANVIRLLQNPAIEVIRVSDFYLYIGQDAAHDIAKIIHCCKKLKVLDLRAEKNSFLWIIIDAIVINSSSLTDLIFHYASFSKKSGHLLYKYLQITNTLVTIDFSYSHIEQSDFKEFVNGLLCNRSVQNVCLFFTSIFDEGAYLISNVLRVNCTIKRLDLSQSCIGTAGAKSIAEALKWNSSLECLNLFGSNMIKEVYLAFAKALRRNKTLKNLSISGIDIDDECALLFADSLTHNFSLQHLNLENSSIADYGALAFLDCLNVNKSIRTIAGLSPTISSCITNEIRLKIAGNEEQVENEIKLLLFYSFVIRKIKLEKSIFIAILNFALCKHLGLMRVQGFAQDGSKTIWIG